ncbi:MAG: hypothetical protein ACRERC_04135 [Candidatus Binatia bacterium]
MNTDRAIGLILGGSIAVVLVLGLWLLWRGHQPGEAATATPTAAALPTSAPPTVTPARGTLPTVAVGHRLAGTVAGDLRYAIIVDPQGGNALYQIGQMVPGLGEVLEIDEHRVVIDGADGRFEMQLAFAPPATETPPGVSTPTAVDTRPARRPRRDPSASESSP